MLYDSISPDALDSMVRQDGSEDTLNVEFATHDAIVVLWGNGTSTIDEQDLEGDPHHGYGLSVPVTAVALDRFPSR